METASERRRRKLQKLCDEHTVEVVAERSGLSSASLMQIIKRFTLPRKKDGSRSPRGLGNKAARDIETAFRLGLGWFDQDDESPTRGGQPIREAHAVSLSADNDPPLLQWEDLLSAPLPDRFSVRLPDDAMAPRAPAGTVVRFQAGDQAKQGDGVLVRDGSGNLYFRRMQQRTPGHWRALPGNDAFAALDSVTDRLTVVAIMTGFDVRWSEAY
jgi:AraC-like DNA-binding protein